LPRVARIVIPGIPHHIVQRGNRKQPVFFRDEDHNYFLRLLKKYGDREGLSFWAYCLMPNHVHLIAVPRIPDSLREAIGNATWKYAVAINLREDWRGCLWQGRFFSCPMDHPHLMAAVRYIERNPVRAGIVQHAGEYRWSSARTHLHLAKDDLIARSELDDEITDWNSYLSQDESEESLKLLRSHLATGRPQGDAKFIESLERISGRMLRKRRPGPKPHHVRAPALLDHVSMELREVTSTAGRKGPADI